MSLQEEKFLKLTKPFSVRSRLLGRLRLRRLSTSGPVRQQVAVQVSLAGVALGAEGAGVGSDVAVGQQVLLQVELPPQTFAALGTGEGFLPWRTDGQ